MQSEQIKTVELRPLKDNDKDYETIESRIRRIFREEIYLPLIKLLGEPSKTLKNSRDDLLEAIKTGRIEFNRGSFSGRFNATISRELKALGASWDRKTRMWKLPQSALPLEVRMAISASESHFQIKIAAIDRKLAQILPEEIADHLKISDHFDSVLWKVDKDFQSSLRGLTLAPTLTKDQRQRMAEEYQQDMKRFIKDWSQKEIETLREDMQKSVFAGNRYETAIKLIKKSHDVSINKAKFLARQETRLLLTKFKQTRYEDAGVSKYRWGISNNAIQPKGGPYVKGQVRHDHGVLAGKVFEWQNPPITDTLTGARNNPGQDYNCRCYAVPIVSFKRGK